MNATVAGSNTLSPLDLSMPRSKGIVIGFTAYAQLSLPQVAEAFTRLGFPRLLPGGARMGQAITLASALIAHLSVGDGPEAWSWAAGTGVLWGLSYFFWQRVAATSRNMN